MRQLEVIIRPSELDEITEVLRKSDVTGLTVSEVRAFDRGETRVHRYRGSEYATDFTPKLKIQVVLNDFKVPQVLEAIRAVVRTAGDDGTISLSAVDELTRIRTGERNGDAV
jgi:nitrogen regulatory protein PII